MAPKLADLGPVARELDEGLRGAIVQKVYHPRPHELWLEVRQPGRSLLLCASSERLAIAESRPESPLKASGLQQRLRKLIGGKRLERVTADSLYFPTARVKLHPLTV